MSSESGSGLHLRVAGFAVHLPLNTLFGVALIAWLWLPSFAGGTASRQWTSAIIFALILLASVLAHELAHAATARRFGFPVVGITLWAFGGYTSFRPVRNTPSREALIAVSGPAATLAIAALAWVSWQQLPGDGTMLGDLLAAVALANALIGVFNLLPGLPLDGGAVFSAAVWAISRSRPLGQRVAAYAGMLLAGLIVAAPLWLSLRADRQPDIGSVLVTALIAAFLFVGARSALREADAAERLQGRTALDLAVPAVVVPPTATLAALDRLISGAPAGVVALVGEPSSGLQGYVLPPAAAAVPAAVRPATMVAAVTRTVERWGWLDQHAGAAKAVGMLTELGAPVVLTDATGRPVGVIIASNPDAS